MYGNGADGMLSEDAKITSTCRSGQVKVLFLVSAYPRHSGDVITPWMTELIRRLDAVGVKVEVLAPAYRGLADQDVDGVTVHRFRYAPRTLETLTHDQTAPDRIRERPAYVGLVPGYVLAGSVAAARLARSGRFDIVHAFWPLPHGLLGLVAKRASGVPLVCTFFGVELTWMRSQFPGLKRVLRAIVRGSDAVTAISSYTADQLRAEVPGAQAAVVPFGAAVAVPEVAPEPPAGARKSFEVLFVGRLVERKGVRFLLEAIALLRREHEVRLHVVGDGPLRSDLERAAAALDLNGIAEFHGAISQAELESRFASCDAFVLPAVVDSKGDTEGLGVVLLEAMVHGKPVVASAAGGILDIVVNGRNGLLVPPEDPVRLAAALRDLARDPVRAQQLGGRGRKDAAAGFAWSVIVERLKTLYQKVASSSGAHRR